MHDSGPFSDDATAMAALLARESAWIERRLGRHAGGSGLLLDATALPPPRAGIVWLHHRGDGATGIAGDGDLPRLPFADADCEVVVLRHVLELSPAPNGLLGEAMRVLAPGGLLLIAAIHPWSPWRPWFAHRGAGAGSAWTIRSPRHYRRRLADQGVEVEHVDRFGPLWPRGRGEPRLVWPLAAAYLLSARKRRVRATFVGAERPARLRAARLPGLAEAARRLGA